jgi:hypothetical protein
MEPVENVMISTLHALLSLKSRRMLFRFFGVTSPSTRRCPMECVCSALLTKSRVVFQKENITLCQRLGMSAPCGRSRGIVRLIPLVALIMGSYILHKALDL